MRPLTGTVTVACRFYVLSHLPACLFPFKGGLPNLSHPLSAAFVWVRERKTLRFPPPRMRSSELSIMHASLIGSKRAYVDPYPSIVPCSPTPPTDINPCRVNHSAGNYDRRHISNYYYCLTSWRVGSASTDGTFRASCCLVLNQVLHTIKFNASTAPRHGAVPPSASFFRTKQ